MSGKPLNLNNDSGCDPVSSNCIIWQGPDIPCIDLCKGDSVSDVVYTLALKVCELEELTNIANYDLLPLTPKPKTFQQLIQALINKP